MSGSDSVFVFSRTADGPATPLRTISGFSDIRGLALDTTNNELFVADLSAYLIYVVSRTADGTLTPLRTITGVTGVEGLALDMINNELIVGATQSGGVVKVYSRNADGAAKPLRTITTTITDDMEGVACDPVY